MKKLLTVLIISAAIQMSGSTAYAQAPSATVTPEPTISDSDIRNSLQDRLKKAAEEKSDVASQILGTNQKRAVVGTLKDLTNNTLTIQLKTGATKLAALTDKTVFVRKGKTVTQSDLVIGDYTIAMGYINGNNILETRRVVSIDAPTEQPERKIALGTVTEVDKKHASFTVSSERAAELGGAEVLTIVVTKTSDLDVSKLEINSKLIVVAIPDTKTPTAFSLKAYKIL